VLAGGAVAARWGFAAIFAAATVLGVLALLCALRVRRLEAAAAA
jgi:hypothetical protein